jgi:hypothetical protein
MKPGQDVAKRAKADKPGTNTKTAPRKGHLGPRSGHK